jgi:hypothetical protein
MKGLNKIALVVAIAAASTAQAELVAMDDASMGVTTGQAGLTIDINAADISIGAVDYKDQGFISIKGVELHGAAPGTSLDNIRMTIDVAGSTPDLGVAALGAAYLGGAGAAMSGSAEVDQNALITDGDLVIALRAIDPSQPVDYSLGISSIELGASTNAAGSVTGGTVLVSNLTLTGLLGPIDIVIDGSNGGMNINAYFNATGHLDMPFVAASMDLAIHDSRGATQTTVLGTSFAHVQMNIGQTTNAAGNTALAFDLQDFSADIDMTKFQLGDNGLSIGDVYMTDFRMSAQTVVYGH